MKTGLQRNSTEEASFAYTSAAYLKRVTRAIQNREMLQRLRAENKRLRDDLKRFNNELNEKLKRAQKKKAGLGNLDEATMQRQLDAVDKECLNARRQVQTYSMELDELQGKKTVNGSSDRIYQLQQKLISIEGKNNGLRKQIALLKKSQADQAKELTRLQDQTPYEIKVRQLLSDLKQVNDRTGNLQEAIHKAERNKRAQIEHTHKMEQELAILEPKYGKFVEPKKFHKKKSPSPQPTPRIAVNGVKSGGGKDTISLLKNKELSAIKYHHQRQKDEADAIMQVLEVEVARLRSSLNQREQEGRLMKVKVSELQRQAKSGMLPPISPTIETGREKREIQDKIQMLKKSKDRQSSLSLGASRKYKKPRDLSALPTYNRDLSSNNILDLRKSNKTPKSSALRSLSRNEKNVSPISNLSYNKKSFNFPQQEEYVANYKLGDDDYGFNGKRSEKIFLQGPLGTKQDPIPRRMKKL